MRIVVNASGVRATGATQVTVSFLRECIHITNNDYFVFISPNIEKQIKKIDFPSNFHFFIFQKKAFFDIKGIKSWRLLNRFEKEIKPDCVFSVFGPSVWKPKSPHLMGYAYPYYVYPESPYFKIISAKRKIVISLQKRFHGFYLKRNGSDYVCETEDVSNRLISFLKCDPERVYTVTNTYNDYFEDPDISNRNLLPKKQRGEFRFVTLSSFATHKNLSILNEVIPILKKRIKDFEIRFVLTVDEHLFKKRLSDEAKESIYNLGRINVRDCPQVYSECDAMFLPTLMECFSASYAEAMKMGKPVLTSDLPFAKTVCNDAALYFDPLNPLNIVETMEKLILNDDLRTELIQKGYIRLKSFDSAKDRAKKYLQICQDLVKK